jgi:hypothetical protein
VHINRREILTALAGLPLLATAARAQRTTATTPDRPNVLLIMADDAGREMFGFTGGTYAPTPYLDALAARSMRVDQCYSTPLCAPSRVELLAGLYPFENGWINNPRSDDFCRVLSPDLPTLGHVFQDAGYRTALAGKWHLSLPDVAPDRISEAGFDEWLSWIWMMANDDRHFSPYWDPGIVTATAGVEIREGVYGPNLFAGFLMNFMAEAAADNAPFFAYYPMVLPHSPFCETPGDAPDFASLMDEEAHYAGQTPPVCDPITARTTQFFPGLMSYTDQIVGRLVEFLDASGLFDNTLVIFTTDNGTHRDINAPYRGETVSGGKATFFDLGVNVPLLLAGAGVPQGAVAASTDFVGLHEMLGELAGGNSAWRHKIPSSTFAMTALDDGWAISDGRWKLVSLGPRAYAVNRRRNGSRDFGSRTPMARTSLYDLQTDPHENHPWNPLSVMTNSTAREQWLRLEREAMRRFNARDHLGLETHYPLGHGDCVDSPAE